MLQLLRRYLRLMRIHDFNYNYSDDFSFWLEENQRRIDILMLRIALISSSKGRWFVTRAERRYGHV